MDDCCNHKSKPSSSMVQTLNELDFERGIWQAAIDQDSKRLNKFIEKGMVNDRDQSGYTALHYAVRSGSTKICQLLLEMGADVNAQTKYGATPLHRAAMKGDSNMINLLLKYKANKNLMDIDGRLPLNRAQQEGHANVYELLRNNLMGGD